MQSGAYYVMILMEIQLWISINVRLLMKSIRNEDHNARKIYTPRNGENLVAS